MRTLPRDSALVVLVDDKATASLYLAADTCLNQLARVASFLPPRIRIAIFYEHTAAKWDGKGQSVSGDPGKLPKVSRKARPAKRRS